MGTCSPKVSFCHKPCTVSGGGKSEISKPITDAILVGPVFIADFKQGLSTSVAELIARDYGGNRFQDPTRGRINRLILSAERSLGSVIKLLTPDEHDYKPDYNAWLDSVPQYSQGTRLRREALLQAGVGARTGASISAWTSSTAFPPTN